MWAHTVVLCRRSRTSVRRLRGNHTSACPILREGNVSEQKAANQDPEPDSYRKSALVDHAAKDPKVSFLGPVSEQMLLTLSPPWLTSDPEPHLSITVLAEGLSAKQGLGGVLWASCYLCSRSSWAGPALSLEMVFRCCCWA